MSTTPPERRLSFATATVGATVHAVLFLTLFVLYVEYVPAAKRTFDEFGLTLPWLTQSVIRLAMWVNDYWWVLVPMALVIGLADLGFLWLLSARGWLTSLLAVLLIALIPLALIGVTTFAVESSKAALREGLAR